MGCHASQPVGDDNAHIQTHKPTAQAETVAADAADHKAHRLSGGLAEPVAHVSHEAAANKARLSPVAVAVVSGAHEADTVLEPATHTPKSAVYTQHGSPPEEREGAAESDGSHARRLVVKASPSQHFRIHSLSKEAALGLGLHPVHEGVGRKRSNSVSLVTRERCGGGSVSRVTRVSDEEDTPIAHGAEAGASATLGVAADPPLHLQAKPSHHARSRSASVANLLDPTASGPGPREPLDPESSPLPGMVRSHSPASQHLGLSAAGLLRSPKKTSEVPLAQKILQKQAVAAAREALQAAETRFALGPAPASPVSNHSLRRRPSVSKHEGSTSRLHVRAYSMNLDPNLLNVPHSPITAHNVQNLFERVATPPSLKREFSFGASAGGNGGAGDTSPRGTPPTLSRAASVLRDKWAVRTEELWTHYAGRHAHHMPKKALMQLSEDLFAEFIDKYKSKLRADFAKRHPQKEYSDTQCDKDLRTDLPFLLPAKASSSDKPEPDDYVYYIYRFTTREMRRFAAAAPGGTVSARDNGVGSIKASPRSVSNRGGAGGNMFNLDAPIGPAHSHSHSGDHNAGGGGLVSERPASNKLTKAEFTLGWGHCHDLLFKAIDADKDRPATPCRLM